MTIPDLISAFTSHLATYQNPPLTGDDAIACLASFIGGYRQRTLSPSIEVLPTSSSAWKAGFELAASHMDLAEMPGVLHELLRDHLPNIYIASAYNPHSIIANFPLYGDTGTITLSSVFTFDVNQLALIANDFNKRFPRRRITFYFNRQAGNVIYLSITLSNV